MAIKKFLSLFLLLQIFDIGLNVRAQETAIDLRRDGRIISGTRKDYLVQQALILTHSLARIDPLQRSTAKLSERLRNKLISSNITALVVPDRKIGNRFIVGVLVGGDTLPEDFAIDEADFNFLRDYAKNKMIGSVELKYGDIKRAVFEGVSERVTRHIADLKVLISSVDQPETKLYAGYLLEELANTPAMPKADELVIGYRKQFEQAIDMEIQFSIARKQLSWLEPVEITNTGELFTLDDLSSSVISRRPAIWSSYGYLRIWRGRSLVIVPEKPNAEFDFQKFASLKQYLGAYNKDVRTDQYIRNAVFKFKQEQFKQDAASPR